ncbi:MAG: FkbM family methyltransferase [Pseudolabrys sp.]|nr:FkbM family methyltransferase [Pseudolabrys sp.]
MLSCVVVDAGARYGLHPSWAQLREIAEFHLFEMDADEAQRLTQKYKNDPLITIYPVALYSSDTVLKFRVSEHQALNSVFQANDALLRSNDYMLRDFAVTEERTTEARSLDSLFSDRDVHFLKLDVEGAEYELLKGAAGKLRTTVLGVRSEVLFAPVYEGAPLFGDLHRVMLDSGFELLNFDYAGAGNKAGRFTLPDRYGKLLSSDAVWVIGNDRLFSAKGDRLREDIVRLAVFLILNNATDLAIDILLRAVTKEDVSFDPCREDPLFDALHRMCLLLFKSLLSLPMLQKSDITDTYKTIFNRDFPQMNQFYQCDLFK